MQNTIYESLGLLIGSEYMEQFSNYIVYANTTNAFRTRLDRPTFWHNQDIIYNFRA